MWPYFLFFFCSCMLILTVSYLCARRERLIGSAQRIGQSVEACRPSLKDYNSKAIRRKAFLFRSIKYDDADDIAVFFSSGGCFCSVLWHLFNIILFDYDCRYFPKFVENLYYANFYVIDLR